MYEKNIPNPSSSLKEDR